MTASGAPTWDCLVWAALVDTEMYHTQYAMNVETKLTMMSISTQMNIFAKDAKQNY